MNERHWLLLLVVLVIIANTVVGGYLWWSGRSTDISAAISRSRANEDTEAPARLTQVTRSRVLFPILTKAGLVRFWDPSERVIAESRTDGTQYQTLATVTQFSLQSGVWAPDGQALAALTDSGKTTQWRVLDLRSQLWHPLPLHTVAVAFSPRGDELAYLEHDGTTGRVAVSFVDGVAPKTILTTRITNARLLWPNRDHVVLLTTDRDEQTKVLYTASLDGQLKQLVPGRRELDVLWAPDNTQMMLSWFDDDDTLRSSIVSLTGNQERELPGATLAEKCGWQNSAALICAVPKTPLSAQGYGRAIVQDNLVVFRKDATGEWIQHDLGIRQPLSAQELSTRDTTTILRNAVDDSLWAIKAW